MRLREAGLAVGEILLYAAAVLSIMLWTVFALAMAWAWIAGAFVVGIVSFVGGLRQRDFRKGWR